MPRRGGYKPLAYYQAKRRGPAVLCDYRATQRVEKKRKKKAEQAERAALAEDIRARVEAEYVETLVEANEHLVPADPDSPRLLPVEEWDLP